MRSIDYIEAAHTRMLSRIAGQERIAEAMRVGRAEALETDVQYIGACRDCGEALLRDERKRCRHCEWKGGYPA